MCFFTVKLYEIGLCKTFSLWSKSRQSLTSQDHSVYRTNRKLVTVNIVRVVCVLVR